MECNFVNQNLTNININNNELIASIEHGIFHLKYAVIRTFLTIRRSDRNFKAKNNKRQTGIVISLYKLLG